MHRLRLRPLHVGDESSFVRGHEAMAAEDFTFGLDYEPSEAWSSFLDRLDRNRRGIDIPDGRVASTFLVGDVGGEIVGRASIRHELNDFLAREGGHIGYGVLAAHRSRGYATEILRQSLVIARSVGVTDALLTCDEDNAASAAVIERCGGVFESYVLAAASGGRMRRYWIA